MTGAAPESPWRTSDHGVVIRIRLTPKGGRDLIAGVTPTADGPALKARVRAVPEDGAANAAIAALVASWLGVRKTDAEVTAGHKSRVKSVSVAGAPADLVARLVGLMRTFET